MCTRRLKLYSIVFFSWTNINCSSKYKYEWSKDRQQKKKKTTAHTVVQQYKRQLSWRVQQKYCNLHSVTTCISFFLFLLSFFFFQKQTMYRNTYERIFFNVNTIQYWKFSFSSEICSYNTKHMSITSQTNECCCILWIKENNSALYLLLAKCIVFAFCRYICVEMAMLYVSNKRNRRTK